VVTSIGFTPCFGASLGPPAIHIVREGQNKSQARMLKAQRAQCVSEKELYRDTKRNKPQRWALMEKQLQHDRPGYDVDVALSPEPDWNTLAVLHEEEYFSGEQYALYKQTARYKLSADGRCEFQISKTEHAQLDDGKYRYDVDLTKGTGSKRMSGAMARQQGRALQESLLRDHPEAAQAMAQSALNAGLDQAAQAGRQILKPAGQEVVAGEKCDNVEMPAVKTKVCYWTTLQYYPGMMHRPIVLKSVVGFGNDENVLQAVVFNHTGALDPGVFRPPAGIEIKDKTGES
jgi:hypothetical protein